MFVSPAGRSRRHAQRSRPTGNRFTPGAGEPDALHTLRAAVRGHEVASRLECARFSAALDGSEGEQSPKAPVNRRSLPQARDFAPFAAVVGSARGWRVAGFLLLLGLCAHG